MHGISDLLPESLEPLTDTDHQIADVLHIGIFVLPQINKHRDIFLNNLKHLEVIDLNVSLLQLLFKFLSSFFPLICFFHLFNLFLFFNKLILNNNILIEDFQGLLVNFL